MEKPIVSGMGDNNPLNIVLFFTRGVSLQKWEKLGILSREVSLYRRLYDQGVRVTFITYGDSGDLSYIDRFPWLRICCNRWGLPQSCYAFMLPWLYRRVLNRADLVKTNQMNGAEIALRSARRFGKPLIARCGYLWSEQTSKKHGGESSLAKRAKAVERAVFTNCKKVVVTTDEMRANLCRRFAFPSEEICLIPNFVDTDHFSRNPGQSETRKQRLCFVGRLNQNPKNLQTLLEAIRGLDIGLDLIGEGPMRKRIEAEAHRNPNIRLMGRVSNHRLPLYLNKSTAFVFPSFYEGHPKALIEAMSCGIPVIASNVPGINNIVRHGETGWLCEPDAASFRDGITTVLSDEHLMEHLGKGARKYTVENFSLDRVVEMEIQLYHEVLN